jgi:hypothetical protein
MFDAFFIPQTTSSNCTVTVATMTVNALRGIETGMTIPEFDQARLLDAVGSKPWIEKTAEGGAGTTFKEFGGYLRRSLDAAGLDHVGLRMGAPMRRDAKELARLRAALREMESRPDRLMTIVFNQGVLTGNWNGLHASAVGAYDERQDRVLIMDVDRPRRTPYWASTERLLASLLKPAPLNEGRLAGEAGGYILIGRDRDRVSGRSHAVRNQIFRAERFPSPPFLFTR